MVVYTTIKYLDDEVKFKFHRLNFTRDQTAEFKYIDSLKEVPEDISGLVFSVKDDRNLVNVIRKKGIPCMINDTIPALDGYIDSICKDHGRITATRFDNEGLEVTTKGDRRFSPFCINMRGISLENYYQLIIKGGIYLGFNNWDQMKGRKPLVIKVLDEMWTRQTVMNDPSSLYIFTDNLNRTSGKSPMEKENEDSFYCRKYGAHHHPWHTQACIRGLHNALPITTMLTQHRDQLNDQYYDTIVKVWDSEVDDIISQYKIGGYSRIVCSSSIFGNGQISRMKYEAPGCFETLSTILRQKLSINNDEPKVWSELEPHDLHEDYEKLYKCWLSDNPEMIVELLELTKDHPVLTDMFWTTEGGLSQAPTLAKILNEYFIHK